MPLYIESDVEDADQEIYRREETFEMAAQAENPQRYIQVLKRFLAVTEPRAQLEAIAPALQALSEDHLANFDKKESLLRVGDENQIVEGPSSL